MNTKPLIAANWKMHGNAALAHALAQFTAQKAASLGNAAPEVVLCPPALLIPIVKESLTAAEGRHVGLGGQDCSPHAEGAFTGDISAAMLKDAGCEYVILGHSERRAGHGETSAQVAEKMKTAISSGLTPILCVGETLDQREAGGAEKAVERQLRESLAGLSGEQAAGSVVAYEPVWAIGSGLTPNAADIGAMHAHLAGVLKELAGAPPRVLYGGSVKASNAREILAISGVSGALVGGASLKAEEFGAILSACA